MKPHYYVFRQFLTRAAIILPTVKHETLELAVKEAERLAKKYEGDTFEVLKVVAITRVTKPAITFYVDGESPFASEEQS